MDFSSSDEEEMARIEEQLRTPKTNPTTPSIVRTFTNHNSTIPSIVRTFGKPNPNFFNEGMARLRAETNKPKPSNFFSSRTIVPSSTPSSPPKPTDAPRSPIRGSMMPGRYNPGRSPTYPGYSPSPIQSAYIDPKAILLANSSPTRNTISTSAWANATQGLNILIGRANEAADLRTQLAAANTALADKDERLNDKDATIASLRESKAKSKARQKRKINQLREEIAEWDVDQLGIEELQFRHGFERDEMQAEIWRLENALADVSTAAQTVAATIEPEEPSRGAIVLRWAGKVVLAVLTVLLGIVLAVYVVGIVIFLFRGEAVLMKGEL